MTFTVPSLPPIPKVDVPAAPTFNGPVNPGLASQIKTYEDRLRNINNVYNPLYAAAQAKFGAGITPYGSSSQPGQAYRDSLLNVKRQRAAAGSLYSSFTDRDMGAAIGRLNDQARAVYENYAADITSIGEKQRAETNDVSNTLASLFGQNADWITSNPPAAAPVAEAAPPPPVAAAPKVPVASPHVSTTRRADGLFTQLGFNQWMKAHGRPVLSGTAGRDAYWAYLIREGAKTQ